jgi:predicted RNase H-like nuclease (RuvC/YqgF family)
VSNGEAKADGGVERQAFASLDKAVTRALEELKALRQRAAEAERMNAELTGLLKSFESGEETAAGMKARLTRLETENEDLRSRVERGRETVERLIARVGFLENQK